jgi:hypothetical protein
MHGHLAFRPPSRANRKDSRAAGLGGHPAEVGLVGLFVGVLVDVLVLVDVVVLVEVKV